MSEIQFYELKCKRCGGQLEQNGAIYKCESCGKTFEKQVVSDVADQLRAVLNEQKQEAVANLRQELWKEMHEQYINSEKIIDLARDIKKYLPEDYFANFCEVANSGNDRQVSQFLNNTPQSTMADYADIVLDFMLKSVTASNLNAISLFIERAFKGDTQNYDKYITRYEQEAQKVNSGIYELILTRDVFLAYSSKDIDKVLELCDYLERNKITCFLALRNLRHGRGAVDNYDQALKTAIDNCRTVVFVSSTHSRSLTCDALTKELPYIRQKDLDVAPAEYKRAYDRMPSEFMMPRVEYLIEDYSGDISEMMTKEFFHGLEWCKSKEAVARRISEYLTESRETTAQKAERENRELQQRIEEERRKARELELRIAEAEVARIEAERRADEQQAQVGANVDYETLVAKFAEAERKRKEEEERKRMEEAAKNPLSKGDYKDLGNGYITFGTYPQSKKADNVQIVEQFDTERGYYLGSDNCLYAECEGEYYKVEPIKWKVLTQGSEHFIVSDMILDQHRFDGSRNNYANSEIRSWLNGEFYKKAFTEAQQNLILTTKVDNSVLSTGDSTNQYFCDNTNDKIFLLSHKEAEQYYTSSSVCQKKGTDYAKARGLYVADNGNSWWWLRSPFYKFSYSARDVGEDGDLDYAGDVDDSDNGVVCALKFKP